MDEGADYPGDRPRPPLRSRDRFLVLVGARQHLLWLVDLLLVNLALLLSLHFTLHLPFSWATVAGHPRWFLGLSGLWVVIASAGDNYNSWRAVTNPFAVIGVAKALTLTLLAYLVLPLLSPPLSSARRMLLAQVAITAGLLVAWRLAFAHVFRRPELRRRTIIVGAGHAGRTVAEALREREPSHLVLGFVDDAVAPPGGAPGGFPVLGRTSELLPLAEENQATDVVMAINGPLQSDVVREMLRCYERGVRIVPMPSLYEQVTGRVPVEHIGDRWLVALPLDPGAHTLYPPLKRVLDVLLSAGALLALLPFLPFFAAAIKLDSPGPIFYRPKRLGQGGRPFRLWKLRTMVTNADRVGDPTFTAQGDARITRVGRLLRAAHIDELPQLVNILGGEMSLVGPRPERYVPELEARIPFYRMRLAVKPGTAGWALVKQGYAEGTAGTLLKLQYDLFYIKHRSFYLDLIILVRTAVDMLFRRGR